MAAVTTDRAEETRRRILDAAAAAFGERGFAGTSLNDLIRSSGVTKGGFYFHFPSKEALALAVIEHKREQWAGRIMGSAMRADRGLDQLRAMGGAFCDLYESDPSFRALGRLCMDLMEDAPDLAPRLRPTFSAWANLVESVVRRAQIEGDVRSDVDPHLAAEVAVAAFVGMTEMSFFASGGKDLRGRVEGFAGLFEAGLRPIVGG
jgi:AcrR family transcriptional regulator